MSLLEAVEPLTDTKLDQLCINTIRTLSIDAVEQAKSGHPGTPMALPDAATREIRSTNPHETTLTNFRAI